MNDFIETDILEFTLYSNNYIDRKLINEIKENADSFDYINNIYSMSTDSLSDILFDKFIKEINSLLPANTLTLLKNVTSPYFLKLILEKFPTITKFDIKISDEKNYTRKSKDIILFDVKVKTAKLDIPSYLSDEEFLLFKSFLLKENLISNNIFNKKSFITIYTKDFIQLIDLHIKENIIDNILGGEKENINEDDFNSMDNENIQYFKILLYIKENFIGNKILEDNTLLILIVEK